MAVVELDSNPRNSYEKTLLVGYWLLFESQATTCSDDKCRMQMVRFGIHMPVIEILRYIYAEVTIVT